MAQREVVLKRFIGDGAAERLIPRELRPHPLSMVHPNIIETHLLTNRTGEPFLVERRLSAVLDDDWPSRGVDEAANLLHDVASALQFLHDRELVHGDVKPDNIGYEDRRYILLDFGICRPANDFGDERSATGSLRTRAPELLRAEAGHSFASDVWALGATVFNATCQRFPLFDVGERPPRVSHPEDRQAYEEALAKRAGAEWDARVVVGVDALIQHQPLREIVRDMLEKNPEARPTAGDIAKRCRSELAAYVRSSDRPGGFSPAERVEQLLADLAPVELLELMPQRKKTQLAATLSELCNAPGLEGEHQARLSELHARVAEVPRS